MAVEIVEKSEGNLINLFMKSRLINRSLQKQTHGTGLWGPPVYMKHNITTGNDNLSLIEKKIEPPALLSHTAWIGI